ncbi:MAG: ArnT family glycosyltransferase [Planctomycetaceae bacterium]
MWNRSVMVQPEAKSNSLRAMQWIVLLVIAFALRASWLDEVAVEHFDEGVYASNSIFTADEGDVYPLQHLYAPPLVPALVEYSQLLFGKSTLGLMLPSLLFGSLTVVLSFHVARKWFGAEAALPTGVLAALSEFHVVYSRAALTDVVLGFFLLLAVYLGTEAVRYRRLGQAVLAGLACGVAWWSKYSGWLPLAIVATGAAVWFAFHRRHTKPLAAIGCVVVMAAVAVAVWSPVWFGLEEHGGYAAVRENHQRYEVGFAGWLTSFRQQFNAHRVLDGWVAYASLGVALACCLAWQLRTRGFTWNQSVDDFEIKPSLVTKMLLGGLMFTLLAAVGPGTSAVLFCIGAGGLAGRLRWPAIPVDSEEATDETAVARWTLPCWVVVVWVGSLTLMTPTYRAYPRLTIPWLIGVWLAAGAGMSWWVRSNLRWHGRKNVKRPVLQQNIRMVVLCAIAAFVLVRNGFENQSATAAWNPRSSMRSLAEEIVSNIKDPERTVVYTFGEPALMYHLNTMNVLARPISSVPTSAPTAGGDQFEVLLIEGPHARRTDRFEEAAITIAQTYRKADSHDVVMSDLVLLNEREAADLLRSPSRETETFHVWRLKSKVDEGQ